MTFPTLYAKAKTGKIKEWVVTVEGSTIIVMHGQKDGKMTSQVTIITKGKNIGKANETTPEEQALSEALSKWNKQYDKDYRVSVEDIPESTLPPLAKKYQDASAALGEEYDVLCKLDGVRCTMFYNDGDVIFQSRGGKPYPVIQEIVEELYEQMWQFHPKVVIDGELYCHGMHLEDITSAVKKHNDDTPRIEFHVFDMHNPAYPERTWENRYLAYGAAFGTTGCVQAVKATMVSTERSMIKLHDRFVAEGYEGVVLRKLDAKFVFGHRTTDFQKYKIRIDKEFKVLRFEIDKNGCAIPWCATDERADDDREEFKAPLIGTRKYQQKIAKNQEKYINRWLKVEFESYSKYGVPTKTKGHVFREMDEDNNPVE